MAQGGTPSYTTNRRLAAAKQHEYSIVSNFVHGYRNREDVTVLPPGVLIDGSQNVLTNTFQRVGTRKGYTLDGAANTSGAPIGGDGTAMGVFDWVTSNGDERNMRAGFLTGAGNDGKLQYRTVDNSGNVTWTDLLTGLTSVNFNFITFFDTVNLQTVMLAVNGTSNIYVWNGGNTTIGLTGGANPTGIIGRLQNPGSDTPGRISGGKNYVPGDILTVSGGNGDALVTVVTVSSTGEVDTAAVNAAGTGYVVNDEFEIGGAGNNTALCKVTGTGGGGAVTTFSVLNPGNANIVATNISTTATSGVGTGLTIDISNITGGGIRSMIFASDANHGTGYTVDNARHTLTGGSGTLAYLWMYTVESGTITKSGLSTWAQAGISFGSSVGTQTLLINGTTYTYDATDFVGDTSILYGVTPDPSSISPGDLATQGVYTIPNAGGSTGLPTTFANQFIGTLTGVVFIGSAQESYIYTSDLGSSVVQAWTAWSPSTRFLTMSNPPATFINQDDQLYVSVGTSQWYVVAISNSLVTTSTVASGATTTYHNTTTFLFNINPINTAPLQGARSQAFTTAIQNSIGFISFEPAAQSFGPVTNILQGPQMVDLSHPIVNLMNDYDFTGGSVKYYRKFLYIAVPQQNTVLIYNMTDPKNSYWEAPQILPISRFSIIDGELYGHSSQVSETYKLFTGYADRVAPGFLGYPIVSDWVFSYENYGSRFSLKRCTKMYVEGYISPGATLAANITTELDGCKKVKTFELEGTNGQFVCISPPGGSLGSEALGKIKLGGSQVASINNLPPKFRWMPTFSNTDFFECSISFSVSGVDAPVDILAFGLAASGSSEIPVSQMD